MLFNHDPANQMRLVTQLRSDYYQIPYDPDVNSWQNQLYDSSGLRDGEHETDGYAAFTWVHNFNSSTLLQLSPFYHYNNAKYDPEPGGSAHRHHLRPDRKLCRRSDLPFDGDREEFPQRRDLRLRPA